MHEIATFTEKDEFFRPTISFIANKEGEIIVRMARTGDTLLMMPLSRKEVETLYAALGEHLHADDLEKVRCRVPRSLSR